MENGEINIAVNDLLVAGEASKRYIGKDNYGRPKIDYLKKLVLMTDKELQDESENKIFLSAYASNNPRSDYHWHCDACYDECKRRKKDFIYKNAYNKVRRGI